MPRTEPNQYPTLKAWRTALRLSTREAALLLKISQTAYSRLERGVRATKGKTAKRIHQRTGVPLELIVGAA